MTELRDAFAGVLSDRYRLERELGAGRIATVRCELQDELRLRD